MCITQPVSMFRQCRGAYWKCYDAFSLFISRSCATENASLAGAFRPPQNLHLRQDTRADPWTDSTAASATNVIPTKGARKVRKTGLWSQDEVIHLLRG